MHASARRLTAAVLAVLVAAAPARAEEAAEPEELTVTARKQDRAESLQEVPLAASVYSGAELEARFADDLKNLSFTAPNVSLEDVGTTRGVANFTIRGLGTNSSIPSIDPTVGVFVDGVYMGTTFGVVYDFFDLEGVEVLRGPQGVLFGRNVTGGAVLLKTRAPTAEPEVRARIDAGRGPDNTFGLAVSGPLVPDRLNGRLTVYRRDNQGSFVNLADGDDDFGEYRITILRPALTYYPGDDTELTVRFERGVVDSDGPRAQNRGLYGRTTFDFAVDETGKSDADWTQLFAEFRTGVALGDGTITNIFGWREFGGEAYSDIDASRWNVFHGGARTEQEQYSNELRYFGTFLHQCVDLTAGLYWFDQDYDYLERRELMRDPNYHPVHDTVLPGIDAVASVGTGAAVRAALAADPALAQRLSGGLANPAVAAGPLAGPAAAVGAYLAAAPGGARLPTVAEWNAVAQALPALGIALPASLAAATTQLGQVDALLRQQRAAVADRNSWFDAAFGGAQDQTNRGAFTHADVHLTERVTVSGGLRYTYEKKEARIATFRPEAFVGGATGPGASYQLPGVYESRARCDWETGVCERNFRGENSWTNWTPKLGLQYRPADDVHLYGLWTKGFRSGGYNFRHADPSRAPAAHDEERQNAYELGAKVDWLDGRLRTNLALFHSKVRNLQREVIATHPTAGSVQYIENAGDATFRGAELDAQLLVTGGLLLTAAVGYTDGEYDRVRADLNGDGAVDRRDRALKIPRLTELNYSLGLRHDRPLDAWGGVLSARADFSHRDDAAANDNNVGRGLSEADLLDASLRFASFDGRLSVALYARNLLDEPVEGGETILPANFPGGRGAPLAAMRGTGATFTPLTNGERRFGVRVSYRY